MLFRVPIREPDQLDLVWYRRGACTRTAGAVTILTLVRVGRTRERMAHAPVSARAADSGSLSGQPQRRRDWKNTDCRLGGGASVEQRRAARDRHARLRR